LFALSILTGFTLQKEKPAFSYKTYGNIANFFENENDLQTFFELRKGDVVAEVGANDGQNIAGLALLTDSVTFYAQDINSKSLNQKSFNKLLDKTRRHKNPLGSTFHLVVGTEKSSNLPSNTFDKIILSATFHEFTYMNEMLKDLYDKLKPGGKLYILESHCFNKTHTNYSAEEATAMVEKHNYVLLKKDAKDLNGATGLYRLILAK
jgi:ubiquinone/menaquinone biosynthesis C-methylase UbiE